MVAVVGILGQELLGVHPAWYLHGEKVQPLFAQPSLPFCACSVPIITFRDMYCAAAARDI